MVCYCKSLFFFEILDLQEVILLGSIELLIPRALDAIVHFIMTVSHVGSGG